MKERDMIEHFYEGADLLSPLVVDKGISLFDTDDFGDAVFTAFLKEENPQRFYRFLVEIKSRSTPQVIHSAKTQIRVYLDEWRKTKNDPEIYPMIVVPYLSEERLEELYRERISGVDLCGNGVVTIPEKNLLIYRTGKENQFPESRPVSNPYQGKSAMVARAFFIASTFLGSSKSKPIKEIQEAVERAGIGISLSQVSKAVAAFEQERVVQSEGSSTYVFDPDRLMDQLATAWKPPKGKRVYLRLPDGLTSLTKLNADEKLDWAVTGESSVSRHTPFAQGGPVQIAVSSIRKAMDLLEGKIEPVPSFANVVLVESDEPGFYFDNQRDERGIKWANLLQTWIELKNGDARQQEAAEAVRNLIIEPGS